VFNHEFRIIALHHASGQAPANPNAVVDGRFKQGIPIAGIVTELKRQLAGRPELVELGLG